MHSHNLKISSMFRINKLMYPERIHIFVSGINSENVFISKCIDLL